MKNYREMYELKVCYYCNYYRIGSEGNDDWCFHERYKEKIPVIIPTGTCDNWREEHMGN